MKKIYFVRHGETDANSVGYVPGKGEPLNQHGFSQANRLAERVENLEVELFVTSDYLRAQQTLNPIVKTREATPSIEATFGEIFEPTSLHGLTDLDERVISHRRDRNFNVENADWRLEDGENFHDVFARITKAKEYLEQREENNILVTSHSFFIMLFTSALLLGAKQPTQEWFNLARKIHISNTGITLWTVDTELQWNLITWNDHAHFADN